MNDFLVLTGRKVLTLSESCGEVLFLIRNTLFWLFRGSISRKNVLSQMVEMGFMTAPVTSLAIIFTGMVLALQSGFTTIKIFNEPLFVGTAVGHSIVKELGPVLTALIFCGRIGAAIAAELGTMKVTEQLDALYTLGTNPIRYLAVPRFIAAMTMLPLLTIYADLMGILGGFAIAVVQLKVSPTIYWEEIFNLRIQVALHGFLKSFVFALIIVMISCYKGFKTSGGAEGVGRATTSAVVLSMTMVLIADYFVSAVLIAFRIG